MAIAHDAASTRDYISPSNPQTWSHTVSGSNRFIVACSRSVRNPAPTLTLTYNGTSCTQLATYSPQAAQVNLHVHFFYLIAPDTGANNFSMSFSALPSEFSAGGSSYTGVAQTSPIEDSDGASGSGASHSISLTSATDNAWFIGGISGGGTGGAAPASGETERMESNQAVQIQDFLQATAGTASIDWTTGSDNWGWMGIVVKEEGAGGGGGTGLFNTLLGVG